MEKRAETAEHMQTSFGYQTVEGGEKQSRVNQVFDRVAGRYDVMNDVMSLGVHRLWKDAMVSALAPRKRANYRVLDVAGGTGDIAFRIHDASNRQADITVLDINAAMLAEGEKRAENQQRSIKFVEASAEALPFEDKQFDAYTIAFGIRNVPDIGLALREAFRVLKPGGRLLCLEFSAVQMPGLDGFYQMWSKHVVPQLGWAIVGDKAPYQYLIESIAKFPNQLRFEQIISDAGFSRVSHRNYSGGIVALHSAWKFQAQ